VITFVINEPSLEIGIARYLRTRGTSLRGLLHPTTYEQLFGAPRVPTGTWVFAALDTLTPAERALTSSLHRQLNAQGVRTLNDPARSLLRSALLERLHDAGLNSFRAVRAADYRGGLRFPVFLRTDRGHDGNLSPLLFSEREVHRALRSARLRMQHLDDLLIVEFLDLADGGVLHKYSAFRVGDRILGRHFQTSTGDWMIKSETGNRTPIAAAEECAYISENPHAARLMPLFELAGIEYGRMDYALHRGRIETFEINTAPTLGRGGHREERSTTVDPYRAAVEPTLVAFHGRMCDAFRAVATTGDSETMDVRWDAELLASRHDQRRSIERLAWRRDRLSRLANLTPVRAMRRGVDGLLRSLID
jgi:hypothetical protein